MKIFLATSYLVILCTLLLTGAYFVIRQIIQKRKTEKELKHIKERISSKKANFKDYYTIGTIYLYKKLFDQAILHFSYCLKTSNKSDTIELSNLYNSIGFTYFESGQIDMSIYYYQEATKINPKYITALNNLAHSYEKKQMMNEAIKTYEKVLEYDKKNTIASEKIKYLR